MGCYCCGKKIVKDVFSTASSLRIWEMFLGVLSTDCVIDPFDFYFLGIVNFATANCRPLTRWLLESQFRGPPGQLQCFSQHAVFLFLGSDFGLLWVDLFSLLFYAAFTDLVEPSKLTESFSEKNVKLEGTGEIVK